MNEKTYAQKLAERCKRDAQKFKDPYPGYICKKCGVYYLPKSIDENPNYCPICRRVKI